MGQKKDLLIEIGTEELPPKSLKNLAVSFCQEMSKALKKNELNFKNINWYATPRRLSLLISDLDTAQKDKENQRRGPSISSAYDNNKNPTQATIGFAKSCGTEISKLEVLETENGSWLIFDTILKGKKTDAIIPILIEECLIRLPISKRMRWGNNDIEFVRPIKWIFILFDKKIIECKILGIKSCSSSFGHRFHHPESIKINSPKDYSRILKEKGKVVVSYDERLSIISSQVSSIAKENNGEAIIDSELLNEVTSLVEWPVSFIGNFDSEFLKLPKEVLIAVMQDNQKYFPVIDHKKNLMPLFVCVANIESNSPELIKKGNERVIMPRLSDAFFFFEWDSKYELKKFRNSLKKVIYQKELGTLYDKSQRLVKTISYMTKKLHIEPKLAKSAAELCLCDLLTKMVFEFPKLQGIMGRYYAELCGEKNDVAVAIGEFYQPRYAGDELPKTDLGKSLAISEKIDNLVCIFSIGKMPTGDKDPFGLRRSAIGVLRILIECNIDIDLKDLLAVAASKLSANKSLNYLDDVYFFLMERLRNYYYDEGFSADEFESVLAINTTVPLDFHKRLIAVTKFKKFNEAKNLSAANKRIVNILKKSDKIDTMKINDKLLIEESEIKLANTIEDYKKIIMPMIDNRDYTLALKELAGLSETVDHFFDEVMIMSEKPEIRKNRLVLLNNLNALFLTIADISKLQD